VICYALGLLLPQVTYVNGSEPWLNVICGLYYFGSPNFAPYQIFTYMFMHAGLGHLFFNMFALWMFGRVMEQAWGTKRFLIYYFVCGVGAGVIQELGQVLGLIPPYSMTIGASGAVYGILLAFGMTFPNERLFIIPIPFPIKAKYFVMLYALLEVFQGLGSSDGVAHFAHLGGMLFGLLLILYWRNRVSRQRYKGGYWSSASSTYSYESSYDKGNNEGWFSKLGGMFVGKKKKPKMNVHYGGEHGRDYEYNEQKKRDNEEIDRILDKIRKNGYSCLTDEEKDTLFKASNK
jgi:membrane associated rhomboid family serine protease